MKQNSATSRANQSASKAQAAQMQLQSTSEQFEVRCKKCSALLCENQHLKIMNQSSYVIIDEALYKRVYLAPLLFTRAQSQ